MPWGDSISRDSLQRAKSGKRERAIIRDPRNAKFSAISARSWTPVSAKPADYRPRCRLKCPTLQATVLLPLQGRSVLRECLPRATGVPLPLGCNLLPLQGRSVLRECLPRAAGVPLPLGCDVLPLQGRSVLRECLPRAAGVPLPLGCNLLPRFGQNGRLRCPVPGTFWPRCGICTSLCETARLPAF